MRYSTTFPATEDPISEGGVWLNGAADGVSWCNVRTTTNFAFGTQVDDFYDDSTALLKGAWSLNQTGIAVAKVTAEDAVQFQEIEIRLRSTLTPLSCTGYEFNWRILSTSDGYVQLNRWEGPLAGFTLLTGNSGVGVGAADGDILKATVVGNVFTAYKNGVQQFTYTDSKFQNGSPGIGMFNTATDGVSNSRFGFTSFQAFDDQENGFNMTPGMNVSWRRR